jgi:hypothetical protein
VWWCKTAIPALSRQRQEDLEFEARMDYIHSRTLSQKQQKDTGNKFQK